MCESSEEVEQDTRRDLETWVRFHKLSQLGFLTIREELHSIVMFAEYAKDIHKRRAWYARFSIVGLRGEMM